MQSGKPLKLRRKQQENWLTKSGEIPEVDVENLPPHSRSGLLSSHPSKAPVGIQQTKDPNAQGIFALYIWRFIEFRHSAHAGGWPFIFPPFGKSESASAGRLRLQ